MSLSEAGTGLLGTHLTWEDLQADFFEIYGPEAILGPEKKATDIADGRGFVSRIAMIENLWEDRKKAEEKGWPKKLVVKMVTLLQQLKYGQGTSSDMAREFKERLWKKVHNVESYIYSRLGEEKDLTILKVIKIQPFSEENTTKGYLIMEFIEKAVVFGMDASLPDELIEDVSFLSILPHHSKTLVLKALAKFHAKSPKFSEEEKAKNKMGIYSDMFGKLTIENFAGPVIKRIQETMGDQTAEQLRRAVDRFRDEKVIQKMDNMAEILGMERLLCHGDLWTVNMLFSRSENDSLYLKAIIDYQICHFGCVGHDLARLFSSILNNQERKLKADGFIEKYFSWLSEAWPKGTAFPFTLEQLKESYKAYLAFASYVVAMTIAAVGEMASQKMEDPQGNWDRMKKKVIELAEFIDENLDN